MSGLARNDAVIAFVQARMSSRRFPGKVLAPFRGRPLIDHVLDGVQGALPEMRVVVATSAERTDDPLAVYLASAGRRVFRGSLENVLARFLECLASHPCERVLRICADSPLLDGRVLREVVAVGSRTPEADLVTTTAPRTFPKGHNAELIRSSALRSIDMDETTPLDRDSVTGFLHRHPERFRIVNVSSGDPRRAEESYVVDTLEDLRRLEGP